MSFTNDDFTLGVETSIPNAVYLLIAGVYAWPPSMLTSAFTPTERASVKSYTSVTVKVWSTKRYTIKTTTPVRSNYRSPAATQYDESPGCVPQSAMGGFDVRYKRLFYAGKKLVKSEPFFWSYNTLTPVVCGKKP